MGEQSSGRAFVCGHPIKHSRSPLIHRHWLEENGISGSYAPVDVAPENLVDFAKQIRNGQWIGGNFTIPHKEQIAALVDELDETAKAIGAVNTVWRDGHRLFGGNTDAYGYAANLDEQIPTWRNGENAVVFGAGGASRAVVYALRKAGYKTINVINRNLDRARVLAQDFGSLVHPYSWAEAATLMNSADLAINTTSLGMSGQPEFPVDFTSAKPDCLASDIVYDPLETPFLKLAKEVGIPTSDGLGMLLHQAVPGFEKWFEKRPIVTAELREMIMKDLDSSHTA